MAIDINPKTVRTLSRRLLITDLNVLTQKAPLKSNYVLKRRMRRLENAELKHHSSFNCLRID